MRLTLLFLLLWPVTLLAENRVALVLGIERYTALRPLTNPVNDARAVEEKLRALGFEVFLETNRDLRRMRRALEDFAYDAEGADVGLIYFAGHGMEVDGQNMLLPVDAPLGSIQALTKGALPLDEVAATLQSVAPVGLLILDACRSDPFGGEGRGAMSLGKTPQQPVSIKPGLARLGRSDNLLYAFAAAPGQAALDGQGDNSPFTEALTRHLSTPGLEIRQVLTLVQQDVYDRTRGKQLPYVESGLPQLVFAGGQSVLPERELLLLSMAGMQPDHRALIERIAAQHDMPLAPLFGAFLSADLASRPLADQARELGNAAQAFDRARRDLQQLSSDDPEVSALRIRAEDHLALGAFKTARATLSEAAGIDRVSRDNLKENYLVRTLSEAETHFLNGQAAEADLRRDLAIADYDRATALYEEVWSLSKAVPDRLIDVTLLLGDAQLLAGDIIAARDSFVRNRLATETRLQETPEDPDRLRAVMISLNRIAAADVNSGNLAAAKQAFEKGHTIAQQLVALDPDSFDWQSDLSLSHSKLGDVARSLGNLDEAHRHYTADLGISQRLAEQNPEDTEAWRGVSVSMNKQGDVAMARNQFEFAAQIYQLGLAVSAALAEQNPDDTELQRDHWVSHIKTGDASQEQGALDDARSSYSAALTISQKLAVLDPSNAGWQRDLLSSYNRLGDVAVNVGDIPAAKDAYRQGLALTQKLVELDPDNTMWQRDLWVSHDRLGYVAELSGDLETARRDNAAALAVAKQLAARDGNIVQWQLDLVVSHFKLYRTGTDPEANLSEALRILRFLHDHDRLPLANQEWIGFMAGELAVLRAAKASDL